MLDDIRDAELDFQFLLQERLGGVVFLALSVGDSLQVVGPCRDGKIGGSVAQIRQIGSAARDCDGVQLVLPLLQRRNGLVLDQRGNGRRVVAVKDAVRLPGESGETGALFVQLLIIGRNNVVSRGDVIGDINSRRGRIEGMEDIGNGKMVKGFVPLSEMFGYATDLRSKTQGRGNYSMFFEKYEPVPKNVQEKLLKDLNG